MFMSVSGFVVLSYIILWFFKPVDSTESNSMLHFIPSAFSPTYTSYQSFLLLLYNPSPDADKSKSHNKQTACSSALYQIMNWD